MTVRLELFATGTAPPASLWDVVGDLRRLPEWTDADTVQVAASTPEPGTEVVTLDAGRRLVWRITTVEPRLWEATTTVGRRRVGVGVRVVADPRGSRIVLAGGIDVDERGARWRARLLDAPALRARFDRWTATALRVAGGGAEH